MHRIELGGLPVFHALANANPGAVAKGSLGTISAGGSSPFTVNVTVPDLTSPAVSVLVILTGTLADESYSGSTAFIVAPSPQGCPTPTLNPATPITVPLTGGSFTIHVSGLPNTCKWIFQFSQDNIDPWISSPQAGISMASPGTFTLTAAPNLSPYGRKGAVLVSSGPNLNGIIAPSAVLQLTQAGAPYGPVQGTASLPLVGELRRPLPGVAVHFQLITGSGPVPADVMTDAGGNWSATGFTTGIFVGQDPTLANTYRATPSKAGYTFSNPMYYEFGGQPNPNPNISNQNFIGTPTN